jgi:hypothetical protein
MIFQIYSSIMEKFIKILSNSLSFFTNYNIKNK